MGRLKHANVNFEKQNIMISDTSCHTRQYYPSRKFDTLEYMPPLMNPKSVQMFPRFMGYYFEVINNYIDIMQVLTQLIKKYVEFRLGSKYHLALATLKLPLKNSPILVYPNSSQEYILL